MNIQELYSLPRNLREDNKLPAPFLKKSLCMGDLLPASKIFIERPVIPCPNFFQQVDLNGKTLTSLTQIKIAIK